MTLFEPTVAPVDDLGARRTGHLPTPTKTRFMPLRAGVLNVWEYDDQQFWFADGRLLLRGRNEAGKSKVLELLFPFVLDGDMSPKKLDPFDTANKSMWWNMIGFHKERTVAIGYLWIEFGRLDEAGVADYQTVIVGLQATRAERKVVPWFAITPQRIDVDLDLAPGRVCRTQESFTKALTPEARYATKAVVHRANVGSRLFAMSPERFDNLLHLLRQLRKPKLADKLDNKKLSSVLTDALPPLDESRIEPLATGFGFLDADIEDLRRTETAHRATGAFLDVYRAYARTQVRQRADVLRTAVTRFDDVTREERDNTRALEAAQQATARLTEEAAKLARQLATATGSLSGLDLSKVESLRALEHLANADAKTVADIDNEHRRAVDNATRARTDARTRAETAQNDQTALTAAVDEARRHADRAGLPAGWEDPTDHSRSADQLRDAITTRRNLIEAVANADQRAAASRAQLALAAQRVADNAARLDAASDDLASAEAAAADARTRFGEDLDAWCALAPIHAPAVDSDELADMLAERLGDIDRAARREARNLAGPALDAAHEAVLAATSARADASRDDRIARAALDAHDSLPADPPPPRRAGIPNKRSGVPFWLAVEFTDNVDADGAAMLEAALDAAGILDAVVSGDGLVDAHTDDTVVVAGDGSGWGLRDLLRPADGTDTELVGRIVATIGAGADSGTRCWISADGSWGNGPLTGRWSKPAAEYIGAAARATAHARRRAELVAVVDAAAAALTEADAELDSATSMKQLVDMWLAEFPSVGDWAAAEQQRGLASTAVDRIEAEHRQAIAAHDEVQGKAQEALDACELAVQAAGCRPDEVAGIREELNAAARTAGDVAAAARTHERSATSANDATATAERLEAEAETVNGRLAAARLVAAESKAAFNSAAAVQGADVERILAEKNRLEREVSALRDRERQIGLETNDARASEIRAEAALEETGRRRVAATDERDAALVSLAAVVRTGHVTLAVAVDATRDPSDYLQPTAGRTLARQIASAVGDDEATEEARGRAVDRLVSDFHVLRNEVGADFDPHLDSDDQLFVASATLNGDVVGVAELHQALADDVDQRKRAIAAEERALIEQHLRDEVGNHLGDCLHAAHTQIREMNSILRAHPTNSGATVQLQWQVNDDAGSSVRAAVQALLTAPATRDEASSAALATFLAERVALARSGDIDGADLAERLTAALDYRTWHSFRLSYKTRAGEGELTARTVGAGSGGQQAKVGHLPLLAAAAGFYSSSPSAPRLCFLDEAFAGIDGPNTADLLSVSVTLDLDMVMTNYDAWFCVPQVPGLAIYHLEKLPGSVGVAAIRYEWDGDRQQELDPWLDG